MDLSEPISAWGKNALLAEHGTLIGVGYCVTASFLFSPLILRKGRFTKSKKRRLFCLCDIELEVPPYSWFW